VWLPLPAWDLLGGFACGAGAGAELSQCAVRPSTLDGDHHPSIIGVVDQKAKERSPWCHGGGRQARAQRTPAGRHSLSRAVNADACAWSRRGCDAVTPGPARPCDACVSTDHEIKGLEKGLGSMTPSVIGRTVPFGSRMIGRTVPYAAPSRKLRAPTSSGLLEVELLFFKWKRRLRMNNVWAFVFMLVALDQRPFSSMYKPDTATRYSKYKTQLKHNII
jgi:hypothetical protein